MEHRIVLFTCPRYKGKYGANRGIPEVSFDTRSGFTVTIIVFRLFGVYGFNMKYFIIFTILFDVCLSQDLNKKKDETTSNKKIGANIENAGNELVEYVNDSFRNAALITIGQMLVLQYSDNWEKNAESIRGIALGVLFVFGGAVGQISNFFKLKRAGKQLQQAGKQLKKIK